MFTHQSPTPIVIIEFDDFSLDFKMCFVNFISGATKLIVAHPSPAELSSTKLAKKKCFLRLEKILMPRFFMPRLFSQEEYAQHLDC